MASIILKNNCFGGPKHLKANIRPKKLKKLMCQKTNLDDTITNDLRTYRPSVRIQGFY